MYVCSGGWSLWTKATLQEDLRTDMERTIKDYEPVPSYSIAWDALHRKVRGRHSNKLPAGSHL